MLKGEAAVTKFNLIDKNKKPRSVWVLRKHNKNQIIWNCSQASHAKNIVKCKQLYINKQKAEFSGNANFTAAFSFTTSHSCTELYLLLLPL